MWWTGEEERATDPFPVTDCNFCWLGGHSGNTSLASRASLTSALTRLTCGKSTTPTTEPGLPGPGLAGLGMGGGKGSE